MAAQDIGTTQGSKCVHVACKCMTKPGQQFCSDYCARAAAVNTGGATGAAAQSHKCGCGHPACA